MTKQKLHFRVHPSILNLIRDAYWYEDRKEWAKDCLESLHPEMTFNMARKMLNGDAILITRDGGETLIYIEKEDKEFKKKLKKHLDWKNGIKEKEEACSRPPCDYAPGHDNGCKFCGEIDGLRERCCYTLKSGYKTDLTSHDGGVCYLQREQEREESLLVKDNDSELKERCKKILNDKNESELRKQIAKDVLYGKDDEDDAPEVASILGKEIAGGIQPKQKIAKKKDQKCEADDCKYCAGNTCAFGQRDVWGCYGEDKLVRRKIGELLVVSTKATMMSVKGDNSGRDIIGGMVNKIFNFVFKSHHYTMRDSARSQAHCPHCDCNSQGDMWDPKDDKKAFIGYKSFGKIIGMLGKEEDTYAACFECPECFKKFFYHTTYKRK